MRAIGCAMTIMLVVSAVWAEDYTWLNVKNFPDDLMTTPYGWSAVRIEDPQLTSYRVAADDFELTKTTRITRITFWSVEVGQPWIFGGDWYIYAGAGSAPGDLVAHQDNAAMNHELAGFSNPAFGRIYKNVMEPEDLTLPPGRYFLAFRTYQDLNPTGKNNNCALSTVWAHGAHRAYWNFGVLADGTVTDPWQLLQVFNQVVDNEWAFLIEGGGMPGDLNCDGKVDFDDIDPFVLALGGEPGYLAQYPDCRWLNADINGDGTVNFDDIDPFVALLGGG